MLSEKPWKPEAVIMLGAGILLSLAAGVLLGQLLGYLMASRAMPSRTFYNFLISTLSFQGAVPFLLHKFLRYHQVGWREFFGLAAARPKRLLLLAAIAGALVVPMTLSLNWVAQWLMTALHLEPVEQPTIRVLQVSVGWGQRLCFGVTAILVAPVVEESLFRGILYPLIKQRGYPLLALLGTSLLFAAVHSNAMTFVPLTLLGMVLALLYDLTDTLVAPIITHAIFNAVNFSIFILSSP
jgi:membrane protease YdiL (CAAX protease family)